MGCDTVSFTGCSTTFGKIACQAVLENGCVHTVKCNNTKCYHLRIFLLIRFGKVSTENYEFLILDTGFLKYL